MYQHIMHGAPNYWRDLQTWLEFEAQPERDRLATALESGDDRDFYAAAFELFLTQFLATQGWEFERHPSLPWTLRRPDYLVHHPAGDLLLEAAVVMDSDEFRAAERARNSLRDALDSVTGPFAAFMTIRGEVPGGYPVRKVADWLRTELSKLTLIGDEIREIVYPADEFQVAFSLASAPGKAETPVIFGEHSHGGEAVDVTTHNAIRDSLDWKQSRYGRPPIPYVVALDVQTDFPVERFSMLRALYGTPQWHFTDRPGERLQFQGETHQRNGMLTALDAQTRPIRTRISAVAIYRRRFPHEGIAEHDLVLCHHPHAAHALPPDAFAGIPQLLPVPEEPELLRWTATPEPPEWVRR